MDVRLPDQDDEQYVEIANDDEYIRPILNRKKTGTVRLLAADSEPDELPDEHEVFILTDVNGVPFANAACGEVMEGTPTSLYDSYQADRQDLPEGVPHTPESLIEMVQPHYTESIGRLTTLHLLRFDTVWRYPSHPAVETVGAALLRCTACGAEFRTPLKNRNGVILFDGQRAHGHEIQADDDHPSKWDYDIVDRRYEIMVEEGDDA